MKKTFVGLMMLVISSLLTACGDQGGGSKPTNSANSNANANAAPVANAAAIETEIKKMMADAATALAKNDADAMGKIYADNYVLVNLDGSVQTRAERLASLKSGDAKYETFSYDEISIRSNAEGTGAIAIARATIKGMNKGKPVDGTFRVTQVYSKTKDGWKQVSAQATKIEAAAAPKTDEPAKSDDKGDKSKEEAPKAPANK